MSLPDLSLSHESFAGDAPTERSGVGASPAKPADAPSPPASDMADPAPALPPQVPPEIAAAPAPELSLVEDDSVPPPMEPLVSPAAAAPDGPATASGPLPDDELPVLPINPAPFGVSPPRLCGRGAGSPRKLVSPQQVAIANRQLSPEQKLLILDSWQRSGLPAGDFGALVGLSRQTLYAWKRRFEEFGPAGLDDARKKLPTGSKLPEVTKRTILMLKEV